LFSKYLAESKKENRIAVINRDDPSSRYFYRSVPRGVKLLTFGFRFPAMVRGFRLISKEKGVSFQTRTPVGNVDITVNLPGQHNAYNALAALA
ncbi:MAG: hypothetical protein COX46_00970, partial [bacterium (Candidatus Ratteibacteria) CG23_combo_of_CG06-09_8_20_14_all_48_7]